MPCALWTPHAEQELDDVLYHVSVRDHRPMTGEQIYYEIRQLADQYAEPNAPRLVHPIAPTGWFYFLHKRWLVFYKLHADGIEVMRVIDGVRDLSAMLS